MGVFGSSGPEDYPVGPFTNIVGLNLVLKLPPSHMSAVEFKVEVSGAERKNRVGMRLDAQILDKFIAAIMKIFAQTISELNIVLDLAVIERRPGVGSQSVAGVKLMMEFFEADLSPLGPAHAVKLGGDHGIIAALAFSGKEKADIRGGSPFDFGYILTDDVAAKFHKLNKRGDVFLWRSPAQGFIPSNRG